MCAELGHQAAGRTATARGFSRRTEEFGGVRASLALQQFTYGLRRETGPFRPSLWLSSNGYFYSLKPVEGEVSRERFATPTWFLVSCWHSLSTQIIPRRGPFA